MCGDSTDGSNDGPYVCGRCDMGVRPDGMPFQMKNARAYYRRIGEWQTAYLDGDPDRAFAPIFDRIPTRQDREEGK